MTEVRGKKVESGADLGSFVQSATAWSRRNDGKRDARPTIRRENVISIEKCRRVRAHGLQPRRTACGGEETTASGGACPTIPDSAVIDRRYSGAGRSAPYSAATAEPDGGHRPPLQERIDNLLGS